MLGDCFDYLIPGFQPARSKSKMEEGDRGAEARENMGREGYGRRKTRKGGRRDLNEGRKRERNSKRNAFVIFLLLIIHSKHEATNIFRLPFNSSETLNKILYARKRKFVLVTCYLFIDIKKAFHMVDYGILLSKLESYDYRGVVNDWFKKYLIGHRQYTTVNGYISDVNQTLCRVPQGSVSGPLLFLWYINDLYKSKYHFYLFADDTNLTYANGDLKKTLNRS